MVNTPNFNLPMPDVARNVDEEFYSLQDLIMLIDGILHGFAQQIDGKAAAEHEQAISTISGLAEALAAKMAANQTFNLDALTDVSGAAAGAVGYLLVKTAGGSYQPSSPSAALGEHQHPMSAITGLNTALTALDTALKSNGRRELTISAADPAGGADGDIHFKI